MWPGLGRFSAGTEVPVVRRCLDSSIVHGICISAQPSSLQAVGGSPGTAGSGARLAPGHGWHRGTAARWHRLSWKPTGAQAQAPVHPRLAPPSCRISRNSVAERKVTIGVHLYQQAFQ